MIGVSARGNKRFVQISVIAGADNRRFADSALKGDGFELLVPPRRNSPRARHGLRWQIGPMGGSADGAGSSPDSLVEEEGFELLVPPQRGQPYAELPSSFFRARLHRLRSLFYLRE